MKKSVLILGLLSSSIFCGYAQANDTLAKIKADGVITLACVSPRDCRTHWAMASTSAFTPRWPNA